MKNQNYGNLSKEILNAPEIKEASKAIFSYINQLSKVKSPIKTKRR